VQYFVSYYDYYQPEAYIARSDTYIEKDSSRNEEIDRMRHSATRSLFERRDVIIVASVSCIYGLGAPVDYGAVTVRLNKGERVRRDTVLRHLVDIQYERTNTDLMRGKCRVCASAPTSTWRCSARPAPARASRTTRDISRAVPPAAGPGLFSTTSRRTSSRSSTNPTSRSRRCGACISGTDRARKFWSTTVS